MKYKPVPWVTQDINKCPWPWKDKPHTWPVPPSILEFGVPPGHLGFNSSVPQWHSGSVIGRPRSRRPAPEAPEASAKVFPTLRPVSLRAELHRSPTAQVQLSLLSLHTVFATRYICAFSSFQEIDSEFRQTDWTHLLLSVAKQNETEDKPTRAIRASHPFLSPAMGDFKSCLFLNPITLQCPLQPISGLNWDYTRFESRPATF